MSMSTDSKIARLEHQLKGVEYQLKVARMEKQLKSARKEGGEFKSTASGLTGPLLAIGALAGGFLALDKLLGWDLVFKKETVVGLQPSHWGPQPSHWGLPSRDRGTYGR